MYELVQVAENTYYINAPSKIGVYRVSDDDVWLIDSGNDKDAGRKIQKILDAQGWKLTAIINTHSNADHDGGNTLLQNRLNCAVYTTPMELAIVEHPMLEPSFLYGGYPFKKLRNKFLMATPSKGQDIADAPLPAGMEYFRLPGHFWDMIGVKTPDDVYFMADCVFGENILEKYHISFFYDIAAQLETLNMPCVKVSYREVNEIHVRMVPMKLPESADAIWSTNIRKMAMTNVPIAAMTWLMVRPEMNTPMEIIAAPYSSVPM